jgi:hypothetical protein
LAIGALYSASVKKLQLNDEDAHHIDKAVGTISQKQRCSAKSGAVYAFLNQFGVQ